MSMQTLVRPSPGTTRLQPLDAAGVHTTDGFWSERLATNRERTIPHGLEQLEASGALGNFRNAARADGRYIGGIDDSGLVFPFLDSDVYKWLEAVGWELGRAQDPGLADRAGQVIGIVEAAQRADGYLGTFVQLSGREPYTDLAWGHELYCIGHLIQAAVAWQRSLGDERLIRVVQRAVDHIDMALGEDGREGIDGHPEIEMSLVELFRVTGQERYLALARLFVERRGRGLLGAGRLGTRYWQDHLSVREAPTAVGHAVRQLYLDCGVVDVAIEGHDQELLDAVIRRWSDMWSRRTYLTGALGSRHRDEAFGDAMELPSDRAYAETCAGIASVMLAWRLLLATGESIYADAMERTLYNAVLPGLSLDGTHFYYTNPLHKRARSGATGAAAGGRASWYPCACCPPNLMRTLSSFEHLIATRNEGGIQLHQFASSTIEVPLESGSARLRVDTGQPWQGRVDIVVEASPNQPWSLRMRVPHWLRAGSMTIEGSAIQLQAGTDAVVAERDWQVGDRVTLELDMPPRFTLPDDRIDAIRGCAAIERGPLVYAVEERDLPGDVSVDGLEVDIASSPSLKDSSVTESLSGGIAIEVQGRARKAAGAPGPLWPYKDATDQREATTLEPIAVRAEPYFAWSNRGPGAMRVWLPVRDTSASAAADER